MTDLSIMISFTSFQAYYVHLGPAAVEKTSGVDILFFTYFGVLGHLSGALCKLSWAIFGECCESFGSVMEARSRNCAKMVQCGSESI